MLALTYIRFVVVAQNRNVCAPFKLIHRHRAAQPPQQQPSCQRQQQCTNSPARRNSFRSSSAAGRLTHTAVAHSRSLTSLEQRPPAPGDARAAELRRSLASSSRYVSFSRTAPVALRE